MFWGIFSAIVGAMLLTAAVAGPWGALWIARRSHDDDALDAPSKTMVHRLERRAAARKSEAYVVLVLMFGLLVGATVVFLEARTITAQETGGTLKQRIDDAIARQKSDRDRMNDTKSRIESTVQPIIAVVGHANPANEQDVNIELFDENQKIKSKDRIVTEINNRTVNKSPFSGVVHVLRQEIDSVMDCWISLGCWMIKNSPT